MPGEDKLNVDQAHEDAFEKIRSNPSLVEDCKLNRNAEPRYDNEIENIEASYDIFQDFQPVAFFFLHREKRPRRWFIRLVTWPYPF